MLILSRKKDESILIDENIKISIVDIKGNQVKIGIEAPRDIEILREEVYKSVEKENITASNKRTIGLDQLKKIINDK